MDSEGVLLQDVLDRWSPGKGIQSELTDKHAHTHTHYLFTIE